MSRPVEFLPFIWEILKREYPSTRGQAVFNYEKSLLLYIEGGSTSVNNSLSLFLQNDGVGAEVPLYIKGASVLGDSTCSGCIPYNESLFLFIGQPGLTVNNLKLFMKVIGGSPSGLLDLYTHGVLVASSGMNLVMPNVKDSKTNKMKLFVSGF